MSKESRYQVSTVTSSQCPECHQAVDYVADDNSTTKPSFYVCWLCHGLWEVGVGWIRRLESGISCRPGGGTADTRRSERRAQKGHGSATLPLVTFGEW